MSTPEENCLCSVPTFYIYYTTLYIHNFVSMHILRYFPTLSNTSNSAHEWHLVPWCLITLRSAPDAIPLSKLARSRALSLSLSLPPPRFQHAKLLLLLLLFSVCAIHWCCWSCDWSPWRNLEKYIPVVYSNWNTYWVSSVLHPAIIRRLNNWTHFKPTSFSRFTYKQRQVYDINVPRVCSFKITAQNTNVYI